MRALRLILQAAAVCLLLQSPVPVSAIYRDEAYQIDYQHALLGTPVHDNTFFYQPSLSSKANLLYTLSEKHVVGAINPKDGSLVWRQDLARHDESTTPASRSFLRATNGTGTVVSAYGNKVRGWDAATGRLHWEFDGMGVAQTLVAPDITGTSQDPVVVLDDEGYVRITRLNVVTGKVVWEVAQDTGEIPLAITASASHLFYISLQSTVLKGFKIKVTTVDADKAAPIEENVIASENEISSKDSILFVGSNTKSPVMVWSDKAFKAVRINVIGTKSVMTVHPANSGKDAIEHISVHAPSSNLAPSDFLIHYQTATAHWAEVYYVEEKTKSVKKVYTLPVVDGPGAFSATAFGSFVFFTRTTESEVSLTSSNSNKILEKWPLMGGVTGNHFQKDAVEHSVSEIAVKGETTFAVRAALVRSSGNMELVRNGETDWTRFESLAGVVAATWVDIHAPEDLARELAIESHNNVLSAYVHRVKRHVKDLEYLPDWIQSVPSRIIASFVGGTAASESQELERNAFGFRKLVVVATQKGRLIALDTGLHGQVLWNVQAAKLAPGTHWNVAELRAEDDTVLVITGGGEYLVVNARTGELRQHKLEDKNAQIEKLVPVPNTIGQSALIPVLADGTPRQIPEGAVDDNTFIVTQRNARELLGWKAVGGKAPTLAWTFSPTEGETITSVTSRPSHDPVASIGKALGDRNVLYKYLSPNLMLVSGMNNATKSVSVYLLSTVSGETLYSTTHNAVDTSKPYSAVFSENWFAYTFFTDPLLLSSSSSSEPAPPPPKSYLLVVSELFESAIPNDRGPLGDASNYSLISGPVYSPYVASASYVIPAPIEHLATTATKQGITPRSLLAYCAPLAAILAIPVPFLNPRRPVGRDPTANEREEGLFRYDPLLDFNPQWTLSHAREVLGVEGMIVSPTAMESTSLVFAYGELDVFGTRVAPIGAFDMLGKGFNKIQLVLTVVALTVGTAFLAPMVRRRQVDALWAGN